MGALWQNVLVLCLVVGAAAYVGRRVWRWLTSRKPTGCWHCSGCVSPPEKKRPLSVEPLRKAKSRDSDG